MLVPTSSSHASSRVYYDGKKNTDIYAAWPAVYSDPFCRHQIHFNLSDDEDEDEEESMVGDSRCVGQIMAIVYFGAFPGMLASRGATNFLMFCHRNDCHQ